MQKNVNEDLPVEAGYAFDMEDDKSISSPEQNFVFIMESYLYILNFHCLKERHGLMSLRLSIIMT